MGSVFHIGLCDSELVWLDGNTGKLPGYALSQGTICSSPAVHNGSLYCTGDDGYIYIVRPGKGR